jgi:cytosine/creatinine deaminase
MSMHQRTTLLTGGQVLRTGTKLAEKLDVAIGQDGHITALEPALTPASGTNVIELAGKLVLPGLVDMHQHLDKSRTRRLVSNPEGTLAGALAGYKKLAANVTRDEIMTRAERTLRACLAHGTVAIRSHTNIDPETGVRGIEALVDLREQWRDRFTLQVVAHVTSGATRMPEQAKQWLDAAAAKGVDAIGGVPAFADPPLDFLDMLFRVAASHGLPLDLHIDEHLDTDRQMLDALIERTQAYGMQGRVTAGHCSVFSALDPDEAKRIADGFARAGIAVVTLPAANLFLQGRDAAKLPPRGVTRVRELLAAGVKVAAASDNIQDPFVPIGSGDLLEVARLTMIAAHLGLDDVPTTYEMVSSTPASVMGLGSDWGIHVGARADLLITDAEDVEDLVTSGSLARAVLVGGRLVAGSL